MSDEDWLSTPFEDCRGAFSDWTEVDLSSSSSKHVPRNPPEVNPLAEKGARHAGSDEEVRGRQEVDEGTTVDAARPQTILSEVRVCIAVHGVRLRNILCVACCTEVLGREAPNRDDCWLLWVMPHTRPRHSSACRQLAMSEIRRSGECRLRCFFVVPVTKTFEPAFCLMRVADGFDELRDLCDVAAVALLQMFLLLLVVQLPQRRMLCMIKAIVIQWIFRRRFLCARWLDIMAERGESATPLLLQQHLYRLLLLGRLLLLPVEAYIRGDGRSPSTAAVAAAVRRQKRTPPDTSAASRQAPETPTRCCCCCYLSSSSSATDADPQQTHSSTGKDEEEGGSQLFRRRKKESSLAGSQPQNPVDDCSKSNAARESSELSMVENTAHTRCLRLPYLFCSYVRTAQRERYATGERNALTAAAAAAGIVGVFGRRCCPAARPLSLLLLQLLDSCWVSPPADTSTQKSCCSFLLLLLYTVATVHWCCWCSCYYRCFSVLLLLLLFHAVAPAGQCCCYCSLLLLFNVAAAVQCCCCC